VKDVDTKYVTKALQAATVRRNMERHKKDMDKASVRELARIITMLECLDSVEAQEEAKRIVDNPECYCLEELIRFSKEAYRKYTGKSSRRVVRNRKNCSDSCEVELS
jgi:KaiC/GvpD/RAD55 family RecA-like ATPase